MANGSPQDTSALPACPTTQQPSIAKQADSGPENSNPSRILALPAELKNRIYRYTLVEGDINVPKDTSPTEPGLLRTCREIRIDALNIWLQENLFMFPADNFDTSRCIDFVTRSRSHSRARVGYTMDAIEKGVWPHHEKWLKAIYEHDLPLIDRFDKSDAIKRDPALRGSCNMVDFVLLVKFQEFEDGRKLGWGFVKRSLEFMRRSLAAVDKRWRNVVKE